MRSSRRSLNPARPPRHRVPALFTPLEPRLHLYAPSLTTWFLPDGLAGLNGALLYADDDGVHGTEVWRTDGTQAGTRMLKDIGPGTTDYDDQNWTLNSDFRVRQFVALGSAAYFRADDGIHGPELWRTDGTTAGTAMVRDFVPGADGAEPTNLFVFRNELYFTASAPDENTLALWKIDGSGNFVRICDTLDTIDDSPNYHIAQPTVVGNELFFINHASSSGTAELMRTDGTAAGTRAVPGGNGIDWRSASIQSAGGRLFVFGASAVWLINPETGGLTKVLDQPGAPIGTIGGRVLFYQRSDNEYDWGDLVDLWASDGTSVGTVRLWSGDLDSGIQTPDNQFTIAGGRLFFNANAHSGSQLELWQSDGTVAGTTLVKSGVFSEFGGFSNFADYNGKLAFVDGTKIWTSDGTPAGTVPVGDLPVPPYSSDPLEYNTSYPPATHLLAVANQLFFVGYENDNTSAIYSYRPGQPLSRTLTFSPAATLTSGVLDVEGTYSGDVIQLTLTGSTLTLAFNAQPLQTFSTSAVSRIVINGNKGDDLVTIVGAVAHVSVFGGRGTDTLQGGAGDDYLDGGIDTDWLAGGDGNDSLHGGDGGLPGGRDNLEGGSGNDFLYAGSASAASMSGDAGNDYLQGGDFEDTLDGGDGDDYLFGGRKNDILIGGAGADTLSGWKGLDTADYSDRTVPLIISLDGRRHDGAAGERDNVLTDVETVLGGDGNDLIVGSANADHLVGNDGDDTLSGGDGNDTLTGGYGRDTLYGGRGNDEFSTLSDLGATDYLYGGKGIDRAHSERHDRLDSIEDLLG